MILLLLCLCGSAYASDVNSTDAYSAQDADFAVNAHEQAVSDNLISVEETNDLNVSSNNDVLSSSDGESVLGDDGDVYFDASIIDESMSNGTKEYPFKYLTDDRIVGAVNIYLANGTYEFITSDPSYPVMQFDGVNIIGEDRDNTFISGGESQSVFLSDSLITNLTIHDMASAAFSSLTFDNVVVNSIFALGGSFIFKNSKFVDGVGMPSEAGSAGGVIFCQDSGFGINLYLNNCSFTNNNADYGGVIYMAGGSLTMDDCSFEKNTAEKGGVIFADSGNVVINNCSFVNNNATCGGVIQMIGGSLTIDNNSAFINNTAKYYGGAVYCLNVDDLKICNSRFEDNTAVFNAGGALYIQNITSTVTIENTNITGSNALMGGAIAFLESSVQIFRSNFKKNNATYGGAVYTIYTGIGIYDSYFTESTALKGGAVFLDMTNSDVDSTFIKNSADIGGAIYAFDGDNDLEGSVFEDNTALIEPDVYETDKLNLTVYDEGDYPLYVYNSSYEGSLPERYALFEHGFDTSIKNQIADGNCWAFSAMAVLESCILKAANVTYDLSEENMKNLMALFSDYGWNVQPNGGGNPVMVWAYLANWLGPVTEDDDPYIYDSYLSPLLKNILHIQNVIFLKRDNFTDNDMIKEAILKYGAVGTNMYYSPEEVSYYNNITHAYYFDEKIEKGNHAVTIVGWDDNFSKDNFNTAPEGDGAWIVKNSWGPEWGMNGYFYVSYYDKMFAPVGDVETAYTFLLNDTMKYDKNYQMDLGKSIYYNNNKTDVQSLTYYNIFTVDGEEYLAAVSTYFNDTYDYTIEIRVNGEVKTIQNGTMNAGYYTVPLAEYIALSKGDKLNVSFTITCVNGGSAGIPISGLKLPLNLPYDEGTSFAIIDGEVIDLTDADYEYAGQGVACIKAFTKMKSEVNLTVPNMEFTYGGSDSIEVTTEASNITVEIIGYPEASITVDGKKITVKGLNAGEYTLSVSTNDPIYITKTVNATITVKKADSTLDDMDSFSFVYGSSYNLNVVYGNASNVTAFVVGHDEARVVVGDHVIRVSNLTAGEYTLNVTTVVDGNHNNVSKTVDFTVDKLETRLYISNTGRDEVYSVTYGDEYCTPILGVYTHDTVAKEFGDLPTAVPLFELLKNCIIKFNGSEDNIILGDGGKFYLRNLNVGTYELYVELNDTNRKGNATFNITINKGFASLEIPEITLVYGESGNVTAITKASGVMLGSIIYVLPNEYEEYISIDGKVITVLPGMDAGFYRFSFIIKDTNWESEYSSYLNVTVIKANSTLEDINSSDFKFGDEGKVSVNVTCTGASGVFAQVVGHNEAIVSINGNEITISNLTTGNYTLNVTTVVDGNHNNVSKSVEFKAKGYTDPEITIPKMDSGKSSSVPVMVGKGATGTVSLIVDGVTVSTKELVNGSTVVDIPALSAGDHNIVIAYSGDENHSSFKFNETAKVASLAKITGDDLTCYYLDGSVYKVRVYGDDGNPLSGAKVTFKLNGKVVAKSTTDKNGYASYKVVQVPKTYTIVSEVNGLKLTKKLKVNQVIKAKKVTKVKKSKKVTKIKITLKGKKAYKNKKLVVKFNGKKYKVKTNSKGVAKFKVTKKMVKKFKKGKKVKYTITYNKDSLKRYIKIK